MCNCFSLRQLVYFQTTKMYEYVPKFVLNSIEIFGSEVPVSSFAKVEDIPRLVFKMYCKSYRKDELAKDSNMMESFFGSAKKGSAIMNKMTDAEWNRLKWSVSTKDN